MAMVTRRSRNKDCENCDSGDMSMSHKRNVPPPWCSSGKLRESKKPKVAPWEMRSSYPLRDNIWEYLREDKKNLCYKRKNGKACCKHSSQNNGQRKTMISLAFLFLTVGTMSYYWISNWDSETSIIRMVMPKASLITLLGLTESTSVDEECCYRMKHLAAALMRAEDALRSALRLRRTMILSSHTSKIDSPSAVDVGLIQGASVTRGSDTREWGGRVALWGVVPLWRAAPPPHTVLALRRPTPSDCWPFRGSSGELIIQLPRKLSVRCLSIEHVRPDTALSAPKHFILYGILENGTWIKAVDAEYKSEGPAKQYYPLLHRNTPMNSVVFRVVSNQGNQKYTCVYRVHVYEGYL